MGSLSLLQGIFPTQGLNPGLQHCRRILYQLSHQRSPCAYDPHTKGGDGLWFTLSPLILFLMSAFLHFL